VKILNVLFLGAALLVAPVAYGAEYECEIVRKFDTENEYTAQRLARAKFGVRIDERQSVSFISRCSVSLTSGELSCDKHQVDRVEYDEIAKIKKYYVFKSQFDVQLFPNLTFVENNGRGSVAFGSCKTVAP
jgi:hypothetical protein